MFNIDEINSTNSVDNIRKIQFIIPNLQYSKDKNYLNDIALIKLQVKCWKIRFQCQSILYFKFEQN